MISCHVDWLTSDMFSATRMFELLKIKHGSNNRLTFPFAMLQALVKNVVLLIMTFLP
jgi:hypothetical protein